MAEVLVDDDMITHLKGKVGTLCGAVVFSDAVTSGVLTFKGCANLALEAIATTTKAERREWRKL